MVYVLALCWTGKFPFFSFFFSITLEIVFDFEKTEFAGQDFLHKLILLEIKSCFIKLQKAVIDKLHERMQLNLEFDKMSQSELQKEVDEAIKQVFRNFPCLSV